MSDVRVSDSDVKAVVKRHWGSRAPTFDDAVHHAIHSRSQRQAWLTLLAGVTGGRAVDALDIGCGTGFLSLLLAEMGNRVEGMDIAPEMLERARAKADASGLAVRFFEGDAESLDLPDERYDLVVERHVIWTVPNPEATLREWYRVLRAGGKVTLIEGAWGRRDQVQPDYEAIHAALPLYGGRPPEVVTAMLEACGFGTIVVEPLLDAALWGDIVRDGRYLITAVRN